MDSNARIFVSGHRGLVGSAICRRLSEEGAQNLALCRLSNPRIVSKTYRCLSVWDRNSNGVFHHPVSLKRYPCVSQGFVSLWFILTLDEVGVV
jgi:nucleoside-diphosphate-sugar epimerase